MPDHRSDFDTSTPQRPYVLLPSGGIIDLANPGPDSWSDSDLALGLARTYRWGGHSGWPRPLSDAQHSLSVLAIRDIDQDPLPPPLALYELLHDAEEGLIGFDCIAPLKPFLGEPFRTMCTRLSAAIAIRYHLPDLDAEQYGLHKLADRCAAASEAFHIVRWSREQIATTLQIVEQPLSEDPLGAIASTGGYLEWEPWTTDDAAQTWLDRLHLKMRRTEQVVVPPSST